MDLKKLKEDFAVFWTKAVVIHEVIPNGIAIFSRQEMASWLFETLMRSIEYVIEIFGIPTDNEMIFRISEEKNIEFKANLEKIFIFNFLKNIHSVADLAKEDAFDNSYGSWPNEILRKNSFDCVGASTMAIYILQKAGISNYSTLIPMHQITPVRLVNRQWYYLDTIQNRFIKADYKENDNIFGFPYLDINKIDTEWNFVPVMDPKYILQSIINNINLDRQLGRRHLGRLSRIKKSPIYENVCEYKKNLRYYPSYSLRRMIRYIFPDSVKLEHSRHFKREHSRLISEFSG
uniref:Transglutaminase-like domain-containing protein n=1 Tax=candidate division CPR3 bacterium TaxID=2268181 RepID=A0A7C4LZI0_UNCC3